MVMAVLHTLLAASLGWSAGFATGNTFQSTLMVGAVKVRCNDRVRGDRSVDFVCRQSRLSPTESDFFQGPMGVTADKVKLTNITEEGSRRSRDEDYDGRKGVSRDAFNLWKQTLLRKPLLDNGVNKVSYTLLNRREVVSEGDFVVTVVRQNPLHCEDRTINSERSSDCDNQMTACDLYFSQAPKCH